MQEKNTGDALQLQKYVHTENFSLICEQGSLSPGDLAPPTDLKILSVLHRSNLGAVFKAKLKRKKVAFKVLRPKAAQEDLETIKREFQMLKHCSSPHVVSTGGLVVQQYLGVVLEYLPKGSLHKYLNENIKELNWKQIVQFCQEICAATQSIHQLNPPVVHRDLKSLNILLTKSCHLKLCDFGSACFLQDSNNKELEETRGTMAYLAPEMRTCGPYSIHSEVYSFGIILWELLQTCTSKSYQEPFQEYNFCYDFQILPQSYMGLRPTPPKGAPMQLVQIYWDSVHPVATQRPLTQHIYQLLEPLKSIKPDYIPFGMPPLHALTYMPDGSTLKWGEWVPPSEEDYLAIMEKRRAGAEPSTQRRALKRK